MQQPTLPPADSGNADFELARRIVENTGAHLFLTGRAGTGKTTFLRRLMQSTHKRIVVAAPTGIAAINAGGVTLHSLFQLDFGPFVPGAPHKPSHRFRKEKLKLIHSIDVLVIDEISMVRADLLDAVDDALRRLRRSSLPFGGVQLLLIGDLRQLPPVVIEKEWNLLREHYPTPYFFSSHALRQCPYVVIELEKVYRQEDSHFLSILNAIRDGKVTAGVLNKLNARCRPGFTGDGDRPWIQLTTHNHLAAAINAGRMSRIKELPRVFEAQVEGNFPEALFPAEAKLILKPGAQVMFIKNDPLHGYYNGLLGTVKRINEDNTVIVVPEDRNDEIRVEMQEWENREFTVREAEGDIEEKVVGFFRQLPLKAAWAITIHKSQGLTFDHAVIDAAAAFAHGQTYVALSRCRTLEGLVLSSPIPASSIISDTVVSSFLQSGISTRPGEEQLQQMEHAYSQTLLDNLFDFSRVRNDFDNLRILATQAFRNIAPKLPAMLNERKAEIVEKMEIPASKFHAQYTTLIQRQDLAALNARLRAAAGYFAPLVSDLEKYVKTLPSSHDNRTYQERLVEYTTQLLQELGDKSVQFEALQKEEFSPMALLRARSKALIANEKTTPVRSAAKKSKSAKKTAEKERKPREIQLPPGFEGDANVYRALKKWRLQKMYTTDKPAFTIMYEKTLVELATALPGSREEFLAINGLGLAKWKEYGLEILKIIANPQHFLP